MPRSERITDPAQPRGQLDAGAIDDEPGGAAREGGAAAGLFDQLDETADETEQHEDAGVVGIGNLGHEVIAHERRHEVDNRRLPDHRDTEDDAGKQPDKHVLREQRNEQRDRHR
ncbi:MAG: hypothetical protein U5K76_10660 [Woeseiaceae bacterium]|nr:hypothetical protein [Woeseiaceae bacterium]